MMNCVCEKKYANEKKGDIMQEILLTAEDGYSLNCKLYEAENALGVVQVLHGMEEHQLRYEKFARMLNEAGFTVLTSDMRGHGPSAPTLGFFAEKDGYRLLLSDQKIITEYLKKKYQKDKIILFAHSMGTITTRVLLKTESENYEKVILSGPPCANPAVSAGIALSKIIRAFKGTKHHSNLLESMAVGAFNKDIQNPKTPCDWLSFNEENVQKYLADPYCGHGFTTSAFLDLFSLMKEMASKKGYEKVNTALPILFLRGESDPCTGYEKGSADSLAKLKSAGFTNLTEKKYPHMRHEILNETEGDLVARDAIEFLKK